MKADGTELYGTDLMFTIVENEVSLVPENMPTSTTALPIPEFEGPNLFDPVFSG